MTAATAPSAGNLPKVTTDTQVTYVNHRDYRCGSETVT